MISRSPSCHSVRSLFCLYIGGKVRLQDLTIKTLRLTSIIGWLYLISIAFLPTLVTVQADSAITSAQPDALDVIFQNFRVGHGPIGLAFDGANIWAVNQNERTVTKLRASDGTNLGSFVVGQTPQAAAYDG